MEPEYLHISIPDIGRRYAGLRIIEPKAEASMEKSMRSYGQMTPVIVGRFEKNRYELIDGFKRLRAGEKLNLTNLAARIFPNGIRAAKAAMIQLNVRSRSITELEKGLVIQSLHREDGLTQVEIAALLNRHKSWVCRRLSLVECLREEVMEHLRLGLINLTTGRELARLPRDNQAKALTTILKYHFTSDETARLVNLLLKEPRWSHDTILGFPAAILEDRDPPRPSRSKRPDLLEKLVKMEVWVITTPLAQLAGLSSSQKNRLLSSIDRIESVFANFRDTLNPEGGCIDPIHSQQGRAGAYGDHHACRGVEHPRSWPAVQHGTEHGATDPAQKRIGARTGS